jgi:hypothetical protein
MAVWKCDMDQLIMECDMDRLIMEYNASYKQCNPEEDLPIKDRTDPSDKIYTTSLRLNMLQKKSYEKSKTNWTLHNGLLNLMIRAIHKVQ